jgi:radical SAM superfamily enzyme YgiQ (UPF0313 family)
VSGNTRAEFGLKIAEHNPFAKKWRRGLRGVALIYPNRYVGGISNLGLQYIYATVNSLEDFICERFYTDVFGGLRSLETATPLKNFNIALISLQYEQDAFSASEILRKSGFSGLTVAGGPCIMENPFPYFDLFHLMFVGEVEGFIERILDFKELDLETSPFFTEKSRRVRRARNKLEDHLEHEIIGNGAYGKALLLEIGRGCRRRCRFCMVRQIYSPVRWRKKGQLLGIAENYRKIIDRIALIAPSPTDHPDFKEMIFELREMGYAISPSSLRADNIDEEILEILVESGLRSLTLAPETGSEKLGRVLNKEISEENVLNAARIAAEKRIEKIKLYFMIGLPGETREDLQGILDLSRKVKAFVPRVEVSVNPLVPKPHTPFQFLAFGGKLEFGREDLKDLAEKVRFLRKNLKGFEFKPPRIEEFAVQTVISRGGRDVSMLIRAGRRNAFRNIFKFHLERYLDSMELRDMPWRVIDHGYSEKKLEGEFNKAIEEAEVA